MCSPWVEIQVLLWQCTKAIFWILENHRVILTPRARRVRFKIRGSNMQLGKCNLSRIQFMLAWLVKKLDGLRQDGAKHEQRKRKRVAGLKSAWKSEFDAQLEIIMGRNRNNHRRRHFGLNMRENHVGAAIKVIVKKGQGAQRSRRCQEIIEADGKDRAWILFVRGWADVLEMPAFHYWSTYWKSGSGRLKVSSMRAFICFLFQVYGSSQIIKTKRYTSFML